MLRKTQDEVEVYISVRTGNPCQSKWANFRSSIPVRRGCQKNQWLIWPWVITELGYDRGYDRVNSGFCQVLTDECTFKKI